MATNIVRLKDGRLIDVSKLPANWTAFVLHETFNTSQVTAPEGWKFDYGCIFRSYYTRLERHFYCYRNEVPPPHGLGTFGHLKTIWQTLWPTREWHDWLELMLWNAVHHRILGVMGASSSTKSDTFARLAYIDWQAAPSETFVGIISTSVDDAKTRIWAHLKEAHRTARWPTDDTGTKFRDPPGSFGVQPPMLQLDRRDATSKPSDNQGIRLIPAGNQEREAAVRRLQGIHQRRVRIFFDELQSLGDGVVEEAMPNLFNNEDPRFVGFGNFSGENNPLGKFCRPISGNGYADIGPNSQDWPIEVMGKPGHCLRLDGRQTPNRKFYVPPPPGEQPRLERYPFLTQYAHVLSQEAALARDPGNIALMRSIYRQIYQLPLPAGTEETPYSTIALKTYRVRDKPRWVTDGGFTRVCGADPAFSAGGDAFSVCFAGYGKALVPRAVGSDEVVERWVIAALEWLSLIHNERDEELRNVNLAKQLRAACEARGVTSRHLALDFTGANPVADMVALQWNNDFLRTQWSESPSSQPISLEDGRPAKDVFSRKSAELWVAPSAFMRHFQLLGLDEDVCEDLSQRRIDEVRGAKTSIEDKKEFKARVGHSPDKVDSFTLACEVARQRLGAVAGGEALAARKDEFAQLAKRSQVLPVRLTNVRGMARFRR